MSNDNSGALFKNKRRTQNNHPHMTGKCVIGGKEYWISAWSKPGKNGGDPWFSLSFKATGNEVASAEDNGLDEMLDAMASEDVESKPATVSKPRPASITPPPADFEDDIPF